MLVGIPSVALVYIGVAIFGHIFLTRLRPGWHITAIGGSRRSAYNSGIPVRRTIALCYVASGVHDQRSARCSSRPGSAPSAAISVSASR